MPVQIPLYSGSSGDTKPTHVGNGSRYLETDTGRTFEFAGGSWIPTQAMQVTDSAGDAILSELRRIRIGQWMNGLIILPPKTLFGMVSTATSTSCTTAKGIIWAEVPRSYLLAS